MEVQLSFMLHHRVSNIHIKLLSLIRLWFSFDVFGCYITCPSITYRLCLSINYANDLTREAQEHGCVNEMNNNFI